MVSIFRQTFPKDVEVRVIAASSIEKDIDLDIEFYRSMYHDLGGCDDVALTQHWQRYGRNEKRLPNARIAVLSHRNFDKLPSDFDPVDYLFSNRDLPQDFDAFSATMHYLDFGFSENRRFRSFQADGSFLAAYRKAYPYVKSPLEAVDR